MSIQKIISGGQTGVDQAVHQAAIDSGIAHGGWCPPGRLCEDGIIPNQFDLTETPLERDPSASEIPRSQRTIWNARDSDGVLIFQSSKLQSENNLKARDPGTELALKTSKKLEKPFLIVDLEIHQQVNISEWITENAIEILSVGGPSERNCPGIYDAVYSVMMEVLKRWLTNDG